MKQRSNGIDEAVMAETARKLSNWGKFGENDEIGTLNYVHPEQIVQAAGLIRKGKVFQLGMNLDRHGPQTGSDNERFNPVHTMLWSGVDAVSGRELEHHPAAEDHDSELPWYSMGFADDIISMPLQCATHWDALAHAFYQDTKTGEYFMWNGQNPRCVDSGGCGKSGVEKYGAHMVGRGILLDIARYRGVPYLKPGEGICAEELRDCLKAQKVEIRKGDFLLIRTGDADRRIREKSWDGYSSQIPGLEYDTLEFLHDARIAAVACDNYGLEVRPNRSKVFDNPFHWIAIPICGIPLGENFRLDALAQDCAEDGRYEFFFVASPLLITGGTGSPLNPYAIK